MATTKKQKKSAAKTVEKSPAEKSADTRRTNRALAEERENQDTQTQAAPEVAAEDKSTTEEAPKQEKQSDPTPETEPKPYSPRRRPLQNAGLDHHQAEKDRQAELAEERQAHNERTGG